MNKLTAFLLCGALLIGCQRRDEYGTQFGINKQTIPQTIEGSNYYEFPEISPGKQYKSESTFCYKVQSDVLCYDKPRKGWENRMVGYQEPLRRVQRQQYNNTPTTYPAPAPGTNEWKWPSISNALGLNASSENSNLDPLQSVTVK
jgi:hypothetical protein